MSARVIRLPFEAERRPYARLAGLQPAYIARNKDTSPHEKSAMPKFAVPRSPLPLLVVSCLLLPLSAVAQPTDCAPSPPLHACLSAPGETLSMGVALGRDLRWVSAVDGARGPAVSRGAAGELVT